ncbi:MAG: hypothetical protein J6P28_03315 [Treponema sp.]|nr:hypothetical protein [Treponema sp.]
MKSAVRQYFFLYWPHSVKKQTRDGKTGKVREETETGIRNSDRRDFLKSKFGEEKWNNLVKNDSHYKRYKEPEVPNGCRWIFNQFLYIYFNSGFSPMSGASMMTFQSLNDYVMCMGAPLTIAEKKLILKMKGWAGEVIADFDKKPDKKGAQNDGKEGRKEGS